MFQSERRLQGRRGVAGQVPEASVVVAQRAMHNDIRDFGTAGGAGLWEVLRADAPPTLLGRPALEASAMDSTVTGVADNFVAVLGDFAGSMGQPVLHPLGSRIAALDSAILKLEDRFGMTPRARLSLGLQVSAVHQSLDRMNARFGGAEIVEIEGVDGDD